MSDIRDAVSEIAKNDSITITMDMLTADNPVALSEELAAKLDVICAAKGIAYRHMNSGAGHDAMHMAKLAPASMLFVPCKGGISHNPAEYADNERYLSGDRDFGGSCKRRSICLKSKPNDKNRLRKKNNCKICCKAVLLRQGCFAFLLCS